MSEIREHQFENGLRLAAEHVPGAQSLAMSLLLPAGVSSEPDGQQGVATMLAEMICRGAGGKTAREHSDALDFLGVDRGTGVESTHLRVSATMLHDKLPAALPLLLDMVRRPALVDASLDPVRDLALQDIDALEDEPQQKAFIALRKRHFPYPYNRASVGEADAIRDLSIDQLRAFAQSRFVPGGAMLGFAGRFDFDELVACVGELTSDWSGGADVPLPTALGPRDYGHEHAESTQLHIGLAYDAPSEPDPASRMQRAAAAVLSGGMSGRLFTEVREKRGLCYAVYAAYAGGRDLGAMFAYAGTTVARAQETCDVLIDELRRLADGIERDEFDRAMVGMKSKLVMSGESTAARAGAIAFDQFVYGRPRTLDELAAQVDAITFDALNDYVRANPPGAMSVVTIGPQPLTVAV